MACRLLMYLPFLLYLHMDEAIWQLMVDSFPYEERRSRNDQEKVMQHPVYRLKDIRNANQELVGFISYWLLPGFVFVEHFAVSEPLRCQGMGAQLLTEHCLERYAGQPIILEVERPDTELAKRRIAFYERLGFIRNPYTYMQPSYHSDGDELPLLLMSYPTAIDYELFRKVRTHLYREVYQVE